MPIVSAPHVGGNSCDNRGMKNRVAAIGILFFRFSHFAVVQIRFSEESAVFQLRSIATMQLYELREHARQKQFFVCG